MTPSLRGIWSSLSVSEVINWDEVSSVEDSMLTSSTDSVVKSGVSSVLSDWVGSYSVDSSIITGGDFLLCFEVCANEAYYSWNSNFKSCFFGFSTLSNFELFSTFLALLNYSKVFNRLSASSLLCRTTYFIGGVTTTGSSLSSESDIMKDLEENLGFRLLFENTLGGGLVTVFSLSLSVFSLLSYDSNSDSVSVSVSELVSVVLSGSVSVSDDDSSSSSLLELDSI